MDTAGPPFTELTVMDPQWYLSQLNAKRGFCRVQDDIFHIKQGSSRAGEQLSFGLIHLPADMPVKENEVIKLVREPFRAKVARIRFYRMMGLS